MRVFHKRRAKGIYLEVRRSGSRILGPRRLRVRGVLITCQERAIEHAHQLAAQLRRDELDRALAQFQGPPRRSFGALVEAYVQAMPEPLDRRKSERHARQCAGKARKLLSELGAKFDFQALRTELEAKQAVQAIERRHDWRESTRVKYRLVFREMLRLAHGLGWLYPDSRAHLYTAGTIRPTSTPPNLTYSHGEIQRLIAAAPQIDLRLELLLRIAAETGRRNRHILLLRTVDVEIQSSGLGLLHFRPEVDKNRQLPDKLRYAVVSEDTVAVLTRLLAQSTSSQRWLFHADGPRRRRLRWRYEEALEALREAERLGKVDTVPRRGFHGVKRYAISRMLNRGEIFLAVRQSGTDIQTLERRYAQTDLEEAQRRFAALQMV